MIEIVIDQKNCNWSNSDMCTVVDNRYF